MAPAQDLSQCRQASRKPCTDYLRKDVRANLRGLRRVKSSNTDECRRGADQRWSSPMPRAVGQLTRHSYSYMASATTTERRRIYPPSSHSWYVYILSTGHEACSFEVLLACSLGAIVVASKTGPTQKLWLDKIQTRVSATASMLGAMKGVKMSGLTSHLSNLLSRLRDEEIESSRAFRILLVKIVSLCRFLLC